jgi:hypothetical protein
MVRTGARAAALAGLLNRAGLDTAGTAPPAPRIKDLDHLVADSILELYRILGGRGPSSSLRPGPWDLAIGDSLLLELDEELHFNRYRRTTLEAKWARSLPWTADYTDLCDKTEVLCLRAGRWGRRWTSSSCEMMFGRADPPGEFSVYGAPRWKQRALYDAMKDGYAASPRERQVARLSVHDEIGGVRLGAALEHGVPLDLSELAALVMRRTA